MHSGERTAARTKAANHSGRGAIAPRLRKNRRAIAVTAATLALVGVAAASPAMAYSGWASQLGPSGSGCYAYTTYTSNIVTPHFWQQAGNSGNLCVLQVEHVGYDSNGNVQYDNWWGPNSTSGSSTAVDGPSWYYGPWNGSGWMCVWIYVWDYNNNPGTGGNYTEVC